MAHARRGLEALLVPGARIMLEPIEPLVTMPPIPRREPQCMDAPAGYAGRRPPDHILRVRSAPS